MIHLFFRRIVDACLPLSRILSAWARSRSALPPRRRCSSLRARASPGLKLRSPPIRLRARPSVPNLRIRRRDATRAASSGSVIGTPRKKTRTQRQGPSRPIRRRSRRPTAKRARAPTSARATRAVSKRSASIRAHRETSIAGARPTRRIAVWGCSAATFIAVSRATEPESNRRKRGKTNTSTSWPAARASSTPTSRRRAFERLLPSYLRRADRAQGLIPSTVNSSTR